MKSLVCAVIVASVFAVPAATFAQSDPPSVTRADVRNKLIQLEQNGYDPAAGDARYPCDIQAAEARVQQARQSQQTLTHADASGYGVQPVSRTPAGRPAVAEPTCP